MGSALAHQCENCSDEAGSPSAPFLCILRPTPYLLAAGGQNKIQWDLWGLSSPSSSSQLHLICLLFPALALLMSLPYLSPNKAPKTGLKTLFT